MFTSVQLETEIKIVPVFEIKTERYMKVKFNKHICNLILIVNETSSPGVSS